MCLEFQQEISLQNFPQRTHPFWNMKQATDGLFNKIDIILYGQETIGSAERSCNVDEMRDIFYTLEDGAYAQALFSRFTKERVIAELNDFLAQDFFPRFGGGIGITRLAHALEKIGAPYQDATFFSQMSKTKENQW